LEFGHEAQVVDKIDGTVPDHSVAQDNPPDAPQPAPAVRRLKKRIACAPGTVTADRGYGERQLIDLGVKNVVIPRKGKPS
jgi:IS5 family transposase